MDSITPTSILEQHNSIADNINTVLSRLQQQQQQQQQIFEDDDDDLFPLSQHEQERLWEETTQMEFTILAALQWISKNLPLDNKQFQLIQSHLSTLSQWWLASMPSFDFETILKQRLASLEKAALEASVIFHIKMSEQKQIEEEEHKKVKQTAEPSINNKKQRFLRLRKMWRSITHKH